MKEVALFCRVWTFDSGNGNPADEHEARPEEFTGLRELCRDALGVEKGRVLVGVLAPGSIRRESVFVDDMKEVAHAAR